MNATAGHIEWLTTGHLADELGISKHTLYKWTRRGWPYCPRSHRWPNGELRFLRADVDAWLASRRVKAGA